MAVVIKSQKNAALHTYIKKAQKPAPFSFAVE